ncbi:hypothetical protein PG993_006965 [Apiospora rasikravindrae]|uniref:DUF7580 domain-containing protein n=1 Tax=Apiospora rasikravindrae TaxID=990691 RepID=A0ABR1SXV9_9PEZI
MGRYNFRLNDPRALINMLERRLVVEIKYALYEAVVKPNVSVTTQDIKTATRYAVVRHLRSGNIPPPVPILNLLTLYRDKWSSQDCQCISSSLAEHTTMCPFGAQREHRGPMLQLVMHGNTLGIEDAPPVNADVLGEPVTLAEVLRRGNDNEAARMTFKEQTFLALDIACSIVQLRKTLWLGSPFTSHVLLIVTPEKKGQGVNTKPFIEQVPESPKTASTSINPEAVLRELTILLLELWHHKTLDTWCAGVDGMDITTPDGRLKAAISWVKATSERIPPYYLDAIEQCIGICCGRHRLWHDTEFLRIYCGNVVMPLQESCRAWDVSEGWSEVL